MNTGKVKWFNDARGFGFIVPDDGSSDVFAHFSAIDQRQPGRRTLTEGQHVEFETVENPKGLQASRIVAK